MKILKLRASKDTISGVKRQPTEWGKILIYHVSDKGLIRIHGKLLKFNNSNSQCQKNYYLCSLLECLWFQVSHLGL